MTKLAKALSPASGAQSVPASGTRARAAAAIVSATVFSGSKLSACDLPQARATPGFIENGSDYFTIRNGGKDRDRFVGVSANVSVKA